MIALKLDWKIKGVVFNLIRQFLEIYSVLDIVVALTRQIIVPCYLNRMLKDDCFEIVPEWRNCFTHCCSVWTTENGDGSAGRGG